eukprot:scaffold14624_cov100-Cylindrotheca_fusiformis.AAC.9
MSVPGIKIYPAKGRKKRRDPLAGCDRTNDGGDSTHRSSVSSLGSRSSLNDSDRYPARRRQTSGGTGSPVGRMPGGAGRRPSGGMAPPSGRRQPPTSASSPTRAGHGRSSSTSNPGRRKHRDSASEDTNRSPSGNVRSMPKAAQQKPQPECSPEPPKQPAARPSKLPGRLSGFAMSCGVPGCNPATCLHI